MTKSDAVALDGQVVTLDVPDEVGADLTIEAGGKEIRATWLGVVSDGKSLAQAMGLMAQIEKERESAE